MPDTYIVYRTRQKNHDRSSLFSRSRAIKLPQSLDIFLKDPPSGDRTTQTKNALWNKGAGFAKPLSVQKHQTSEELRHGNFGISR
jgi:hypothetical protein